MTAPLPAPLFVWTPADSVTAGHIAVALVMMNHGAHSEVIIESAVELQHRAPRLLDAQRFQLASARLYGYGDTTITARAAQIARRIALALDGPAVHLRLLP